MRQKIRTLAARLLGDQRGAGTVLVFGLMAASVGAFSLANLFAFNLLQQARLQAQTESIALAATDALRGLNTGFPCAEAQRLASLYRLQLDRCRIVKFEVFISTRLNGLGIVLTATAHAGPS
jgi:ABC-type uncharacterized transport system permease subunit